MPNLAYDGKSGQVLWYGHLRFTKTELYRNKSSENYPTKRKNVEPSFRMRLGRALIIMP
jgi:hypothetical protein